MKDVSMFFLALVTMILMTPQGWIGMLCVAVLVAAARS